MGERLNDVYNNPEYTDNDFIVRSLNTILESGSDSSTKIYTEITYYAELTTELLQTSPVKRPDVKFIVEQINAMQTNNTFAEFKKLFSSIYKQDMTNYKYLYLMCYCRTLFEIFYKSKILFTKPDYAIMQAMGYETWNVFQKAFTTGEYTYLPNTL